MSKIAIVTDSNSGITQEEGRRLGVSVLPMPFFINEKMYLEGITLTQEEFYKWLEQDATISTSQPSPGETMGLWDSLLKEYDEIVQIPMSSGLSATCATAMALSQEYAGRVHVVDNLEDEKSNSSIYITLETLKYLKKGGRITPAAAAIGTVLNLKPVLQIQGEKLDAYAKVRGKKQARRTMLKAMKADFEGRFKDFVDNGEMCLGAAYTGNPEEAMEWKQEIQEAFPGMDIHMDPLSLSVACHIGQGSLAIACAKKVRI